MAVGRKQYQGFLRAGTYAVGFSLAVAAQAETDAPVAPSPSRNAPAAELEEVTVTAEKKVENLQQVPVSVTAVTAEQVEAAHSVNLEGLAGSIPNVQIGNFANTPQSATINIRGMGVIDPDPYAGTTVTVVMDGVPQYFNQESLLNLFDVDRIDVLKGPQGTLFGANSTGGVVNVGTKQPTGQYGGTVEATVGNYSRIDAEAALDFPIIQDLLAGKITVEHSGQDGYVRNIVNGLPMGNIDEDAIRGYLKYTPGDGFDATLIVEYDRHRDGSPIVVAGDIPGEAEYIPPGTVVDGSGPMYVSPCVPAGQPCHAPANYESASTVPDISNLDSYAATLTMNWDSDYGQITSITGYKNFQLREITDQDGTPVFEDATDRLTNAWQFSEEMRDTLHPADNVEILFGGFALVDHYDLIQKYEVQFAAPGFTQDTLQDQNNWSGSVFAQGYWHITPAVTMLAGLRATYEWTDMRVSILNYIQPDGIATFNGGTALGGFTVEDSHSWDNLAGKFGLNWQVDDNVFTYAYYAHGFKSGGFVGRITIPSDIGPFAPEYVDTVEAGIKSDWLNHHLRVNFAGFNNWYQDMQLAEIYFTKNQFGQTVNGNTILNAASADIPGGELEVEAKPTADLTLNASIGYLHARYTQFELNTPATTIAPAGKINLSGYQLQDAPDWTATTGFSYLLPFGPPGETLFTTQYRFTGAKYDYSLENTPRSRVQPTHYVDLTVDWTAPAGDWSVQLWARNITDNHYIASVYDAPGTLGLVNYAPPRMYGATAKFTFGGTPAPSPASPLPPIPAPAPVAAPAPAVAEPARSFQVFFDFDKSDITAAAAKVIQAAADAVRAGHVVQITVTGHTDTVGSAAYNQGLSERRASAVKQGLVADGVPNGEITTIGVGKSGLLVPTADGVREPQNRRAEIVLQ